MPITPSAIRQRIATAVDAVSGLHESRWGWSLFASDTDHAAPGAFAVGLPATSPLSSRQRLSEGARVRTIASVKYAHRLRSDAQVGDYDAALAVEASIVVAVMAMSLADLSLLWAGEPSREVTPAGDWFLGELRFQVDHLYALQ